MVEFKFKDELYSLHYKEGIYTTTKCTTQIKAFTNTNKYVNVHIQKQIQQNTLVKSNSWDRQFGSYSCSLALLNFTFIVNPSNQDCEGKVY